ncbi:MAG: hypothetical protein A3A88_09245 [Nitrospirae bacterium RIFCSPLOWO2_01_FULL_62_17]|nr:MAG: hypothetical protein A3A88_09245 [Nitrospirae bacterium RIFCSPLOWO2_01_FULL_62_17]OGW92003.1 MAG: hypothetical protein A3K11_12930 [Nitrospirae bacterium RIFCSPLOWO2_12_FULL_63_8]
MLGLLLVACATPPPKAGDYRRQVPSDYLGLVVDSDLLSTSRLDSEDKAVAQELLKTYYNTEYSLRVYIEALEANLAENERLGNEYTTAEAIVGGIAGLSSIGVIYATAAIAVPIAGVLWIGASQYIQHYEIDPQIKKTDRQLVEAQRLLTLFPDVEKLFNALAFAETYSEVHRRFIKWSAYVKNLEERTSRFFAKAGGQPPAPESHDPGTSPVTPPSESPSPN